MVKKDKKHSATEKRLEMLAAQTENQKKALVSQLRKTPIVQLACERTDVGRSTYYKWRATDVVFARAADQAKEAGRFLVNDMAESRLMSLIRNDNLTAIIFWLKHNHPAYANVNRIVHEYVPQGNRLSVEEEHASLEALSKIMAQKIFPREHTSSEVRQDIEREEQEDKQREKTEKNLEKYEE